MRLDQRLVKQLCVEVEDEELYILLLEVVLDIEVQ
ncbi:MAG: hypothetical protein CM15mV81_260 [uncultured marine virus]|nr:MAG: hypothetical protein CM15mV81_260 [uncultured marine virus]